MVHQYPWLTTNRRLIPAGKIHRPKHKTAIQRSPNKTKGRITEEKRDDMGELSLNQPARPAESNPESPARPAL
jgi:hypothetical protein